jgi:hypothetical protein
VLVTMHQVEVAHEMLPPLIGGVGSAVHLPSCHLATHV